MQHGPSAPFKLFLFVLALVLFFLGALPVPAGSPYEAWRLRLVSAGLFCWCLSTWF